MELSLLAGWSNSYCSRVNGLIWGEGHVRRWGEMQKGRVLGNGVDRHMSQKAAQQKINSSNTWLCAKDEPTEAGDGLEDLWSINWRAHGPRGRQKWICVTCGKFAFPLFRVCVFKPDCLMVCVPDWLWNCSLWGPLSTVIILLKRSQVWSHVLVCREASGTMPCCWKACLNPSGFAYSCDWVGPFHCDSIAFRLKNKGLDKNTTRWMSPTASRELEQLNGSCQHLLREMLWACWLSWKHFTPCVLPQLQQGTKS